MHVLDTIYGYLQYLSNIKLQIVSKKTFTSEQMPRKGQKSEGLKKLIQKSDKRDTHKKTKKQSKRSNFEHVLELYGEKISRNYLKV